MKKTICLLISTLFTGTKFFALDQMEYKKRLSHNLLQKICGKIIKPKRMKYETLNALICAHSILYKNEEGKKPTSILPFTKKKFDIITNLLRLSPDEYQILEHLIKK